MSNLVFPAFPGLGIQVRRRPIYATKILESVSGKEDRAAFQSTPRYAYVLTFPGLRTAGANEVQQLLDFIDTHKGCYEDFLFNDPYDGVQRRVRFDIDEPELERVVAGWWQLSSLELISVK